MCNLPSDILLLLRGFEPALSERVWPYALTLLVGTILAPGQRTVAAALRVLGLQGERQFQNYHRVLNRARWSSLTEPHPAAAPGADLRAGGGAGGYRHGRHH